MEKILKKSNRLDPPRMVSVQLRREIYNRISRIAASNSYPISRVVCAIVEDFCDRFPADCDPEPEVSGDE